MAMRLAMVDIGPSAGDPPVALVQRVRGILGRPYGDLVAARVCSCIREAEDVCRDWQLHGIPKADRT